jgi:hypothetical protein
MWDLVVLIALRGAGKDRILATTNILSFAAPAFNNEYDLDMYAPGD